MMKIPDIAYAVVVDMESEPEYIQLQSWDELVEWLEREGAKILPNASDWNPKPKRRDRRKPPQEEGLF